MKEREKEGGRRRKGEGKKVGRVCRGWGRERKGGRERERRID